MVGSSAGAVVKAETNVNEKSKKKSGGVDESQLTFCGR